MKTYHIRIVDATRIDKVKPVYGPKGGPATKKKKVRVPAFRVKSMGKNGETLQTSEVLNTAQAVKKHIEAMKNAWDTYPYLFKQAKRLEDHTKKQSFAKRGYANPKK